MKVTKTPQQNRNTCIKKKSAHPEIRNAKGTYFQLFLTYFFGYISLINGLLSANLSGN